jgi:hypothetical protein
MATANNRRWMVNAGGVTLRRLIGGDARLLTALKRSTARGYFAYRGRNAIADCKRTGHKALSFAIPTLSSSRVRYAWRCSLGEQFAYHAMTDAIVQNLIQTSRP